MYKQTHHMFLKKSITINKSESFYIIYFLGFPRVFYFEKGSYWMKNFIVYIQVSEILNSMKLFDFDILYFTYWLLLCIIYYIVHNILKVVLVRMRMIEIFTLKSFLNQIQIVYLQTRKITNYYII